MNRCLSTNAKTMGRRYWLVPWLSRDLVQAHLQPSRTMPAAAVAAVAGSLGWEIKLLPPQDSHSAKFSETLQYPSSRVRRIYRAALSVR